MVNYRTSRLIPTLLTVVIIIVAIVGLISLARVLLSSGSSSTASTPQQDTARQALLDSTDGSAVAMSVRGPIVADENFRSYQVTITPTSRAIKTYTGYLQTVVDQKDLTNNVAAYEQFVHALDKATLASGKQLSDDKNDVRGICATGRVYEFTVKKGDDTKLLLWTSSCGGSPGSLKGNTAQLSNLFLNQIPGANTLVSGLAI